MKKFFIVALICLNSLILSSQYIYSAENLGCSVWAEKEIIEAMNENIIPEHLQNNYKSYITRREFCELAVQTIMAKSGRSIEQYEKDNNIVTDKNTFNDTDSEEVLLAHKLGIVSGTGGGRFSPNDYITRQQAAVVLDNIVKFFELKTEIYIYEKFIDEEYFASWAKDEIYDITRTKSGDNYVMMGTEKGKFSPWMNYTREQAVSTMLRLYKIFEDNMNLYTENTKIHLEQMYDSSLACIIGEEFYFMHNGAITDSKFKELFKPGEYEFPYGHNELIGTVPKGVSYYFWCRAYKDKAVVKNKEGEMVVIDSRGNILTKPCKEGYTLYNDKYAFEGKVYYGDPDSDIISEVKYAEAKENNSYLIHISEADKIIDLETGEYITDNDLKEKIKSGKTPKTQYEGHYNYKIYKIDIEEPLYAEYRKNIPQGWEVEEALIVPRSCGKIVFVLEKWIGNLCYNTLYDGNNFIVPPKPNTRLLISPMLQGKCFKVVDNTTVSSDYCSIIDAYGRVILEYRSNEIPYHPHWTDGCGKDMLLTDSDTKKVVFEY